MLAWLKLRGFGTAICLPSVLVASLILAAGPFSGSAPAQHAAELQRLYQRLDEQQRRIEQLETRRLPPVKTATGPMLNAVHAPSAGNEVVTRQLSDLDRRLADIEKRKNIVTSGTSNATMRVTGRVNADFWSFPETSPGINAFETGDADTSVQDRFGFRRLRFGVRGNVKDNMEYRIEMEFAGGSDVEFRDAWLGFNDVPLFQTVLIGNQKRPYGLDYMNSSRFNVFMERPFVIEAVNQNARRLGIASYAYSDDLQYNWRYGVYNLRDVQDEGDYISNHFQAEFAWRLANTWWYDEASDGRGYGHWGIAGTIAHPDGNTNTDNTVTGPEINEARFRTRPEARSSNRWIDTGTIAGADWYQLVGLEGVLNFGPIQWVGEYQNVWLQREAGFGPDLHFDGGYTYVSYFLTGEHMPWNRKTGTLARVQPFENFWLVDTCCDGVRAGWGAWQIAARLSYASFTDEDIAGGIGNSVTFGLNWYWNAYARMQFNYIYGDIKAHAPVDGFASGHYSIIGTRFMIDF